MSWDVIVMGGGTAGFVAGVAAARQGARTLLVERAGHLGGQIGTGMNLGGFFDGRNRQIIGGIPAELVERVVAMGGSRGHIFFENKDRWISSTASLDPEIFKHVAFEMIQESGCRLWLYTSFVRALREGGRVVAAEVVNKGGVRRLEAPVFVDATGDADLAASIDVPFERGGGTRQQAVTCIFRVGNVERGPLERFMQEHVNTEGREAWTFDNAPLRAGLRYWTPWKLVPEVARRFPKIFCVYFHGTSGDLFINSTHIAIDPLDPDAISTGTMQLRKQAMEITAFLKGNVPGFTNAYLAHVYDVGVRESRRIVGEYTLTMEDIASERTFDDAIAMGAYPPDLHDAEGGSVLVHGRGWRDAYTEEELPQDEWLPYNPGYQIPYRALQPQGVDNLVVAGRCISATFEAQSGTRGMGPCMSMGQAAGTAAAAAVKDGGAVKRVDVKRLRGTLIDNGACVGQSMPAAAAAGAARSKG